MFAVVEIAGFQYRVQPSDIVTVPLLKKNIGDEFTFDSVLVAGDGSQVSVGAPKAKATVKATVLAHGKAEKVIVFHKKRRKGYRKKNGHRQHFTKIQIGDIAL